MQRLRAPGIPCCAFVAIALVAAACRHATAPSSDLAVAAAKAKGAWAAAGLTSYSFVASRSCECSVEASGPTRIVVQNGALVSATTIVTGASVDTSLWFDFNGLFALIERELIEQPSLLEASFDPTWGFPTRVKYGLVEVDAGAIIVVTEFAPG